MQHKSALSPPSSHSLPGIQSYPEGSSTTVRGIPIRFSGGYWARHQLHPSITYISMPSTLMELHASDLRNSIDYPSTTLRRIPIPFAGGYWTRGQIHTCIRYVPTHQYSWSYRQAISRSQWLIPPQQFEILQFGLMEVIVLNVSYMPV